MRIISFLAVVILLMAGCGRSATSPGDPVTSDMLAEGFGFILVIRDGKSLQFEASILKLFSALAGSITVKWPLGVSRSAALFSSSSKGGCGCAGPLNVSHR